MIKLALYLIVVALIALGAAWVAERPGEVSIVWLGYRTETSILVAASVLLALIVGLIVIFSAIRAIVRAPDRISGALVSRRREKAYRAIARGLIAVGAGHSRVARKAAAEAGRLAAQEPLTLLLTAQSAQLSGDRDGAEVAFRAMAERDDTKLLGLRGLFIEAQRKGDALLARDLAEEAVKAAPESAWAGVAALSFRSSAGDWVGALKQLESNARAKLIDKAIYRRHRAILLTARALDLAETDRALAKALALEAVRLAPELVPAAALSGRLCADTGEAKKAARIIEAAWRINPHPDLAHTYAHLRTGGSARDRLARIESLVRLSINHQESAIAFAGAAFEAQEFGKARNALAPFTSAPTQRVALLMAEIEQAEHGDQGRAREWMARALRAKRDPVWTADGFVSDNWMPISPVTGRLDAFEWKVPLAEIGPGRTRNGADAPMMQVAVTARSQDRNKSPQVPATTGRAAPRNAPLGEAVIPLLHAPDDPGPDPRPSSGKKFWQIF